MSELVPEVPTRDQLVATLDTARGVSIGDPLPALLARVLDAAGGTKAALDFVRSLNNATGTLAPALVTGLVDALARRPQLDSNGKLPTSTLPPLAITDVFTVASQTAMLALDAQRGDLAIRTDVATRFILAGDDPRSAASWLPVASTAKVDSVAGKVGVVALEVGDVLGLTQQLSDLGQQYADAVRRIAAVESVQGGGASDVQSPTLAFTGPSAGQTVSGSVTITGTADDNVGVTRVVVTAGGITLADASITGRTWSVPWATTMSANGTVELTARGYDAAGNVSAVITRGVSVSNAGGTSLTARPSWTTAAAAAGPVDLTPRNTRAGYTLPNMPAAGGDVKAAWDAAFGSSGTAASGDLVLLPAGTFTCSGSADVRRSVSIRTQGAAFGQQTIIRFTDPIRCGVRIFANDVDLFGASADSPFRIEAVGVAGRGDQNEQGHASLHLAPGTTGFRGQDLDLRYAKAAGVFCYGTSRGWLNRVRVYKSWADGFHVTRATSYMTFTDCVSEKVGDDCFAQVFYDNRDTAGTQSHHIEWYRCTGKTNAHGRGFAVICCPDIYADLVTIEGSGAAGVIIDREAQTTKSSSNANAGTGAIYNVLLQRFTLNACNWNNTDHGSVFYGNGNAAERVYDVRLETFTVRDSRSNQTAVRAVVYNTGTVVAVNKDFRFVGGLPSTNNRDRIGGNATGTGNLISMEGWLHDTSGPNDTVPPTVVIHTPGQLSTVSGVLVDSSTNGTITDETATYLMRNTQSVRGKAGSTRGGLSRLVVKAGDTVLLDATSGFGDGSLGAWKVAWDTTQYQNGAAQLTATATDTAGQTSTDVVDVIINNATPGQLAGMPSTGTADTTAPTPPTSLAVARNAATTANLSWAAGTDNVAVRGYNVRRTASGGSPVLLTSSPITALSYSDTGLTGSTAYTYEVQTVDTSGNVSTWASITASAYVAPADTTPPSTVTNLAAARVSGGANLTWTAATDNVAVAGYRVYGTVAGGTPSLLSGTSLITSTSYSATGFADGSGLYFEVESVDTAGNAQATRANVSTGGYTAPQPAAGTSAAPPSTSAARLLYVEPTGSTAAGDGRISTMPEQVTGKTFGWATESERPFLVAAPSGTRKLARFDNRRMLLEGSGVAGRAKITVTLVIAVRKLPAELRCGILSASPEGVEDVARTSGQFLVSHPTSMSDTAWQSVSLNGAPVTAAADHTLAQAIPFEQLAVLQVFLSADGTVPIVRVNGVAASGSPTAGTASSLLQLDRLLLGSRWKGPTNKAASPSYFDLGALLVHEGHLSNADQTAVRSWAANLWGTPAPA